MIPFRFRNLHAWLEALKVCLYVTSWRCIESCEFKPGLVHDCQQAWSYLDAAVRLGKELKVWSLQNEALLCKIAVIKRNQLVFVFPFRGHMCVASSRSWLS